MRSSTFSSERPGSAVRAAAQLLAFVAGGLAALGLVWVISQTGVFGPAGIDARVRVKWMPRLGPPLPTAYLQAEVPTGKYFRRRSGRRSETARVLARGAEARGIRVHPYGDDPPVHVSFGRYGFRDEYPPVAGGTAVIGASYVEAAFAEAADTIPGWLRRDHQIAAANFGTAFAGGFTALHVLERYVLPTHPNRVVWVFPERAAFERLISEKRGGRPVRPEGRLTEGLAVYTRKTVMGLGESALLRSRQRLHSWFPGWIDRLPGNLAALQPVAASPHGSFSLAGEEVPVDVALLWKANYARLAPPLLATVLQRMQALTRTRGIDLSVVYIPSRYRLLDGLWIRRPKRHRDLPDLYPLLERECRRLGIPVIDATPALRARLDEGVLILNPIHDQHLNAEGMRTVARLIAAQ